MGKNSKISLCQIVFCLVLASIWCLSCFAQDSEADFLIRAQEYLRAGLYNKASFLYMRATEVNPKNKDAFYNLGLVYMITSDYKKAIVALRRAIELDSLDIQAYKMLAACYNATTNFQEAINSLNVAIKINDADADLFGLMGASYARIGDIDAATENLKKSISLNSSNLESYFNLGLILSNQKRYQEAKTYLDKALVLGLEESPRDEYMVNMIKEKLSQNEKEIAKQ